MKIPKPCKVRLFSYEPLARDPDHEQPWSDTWLEVDLGKGETLKKGPTIEGLVELKSEIRMEKNLGEDHPDIYDAGEVERLENVLGIVKAGNWHCESWEDNGTPTLTGPYEMVTQNVVEEGIAWYLAEYHDIRGCRFEWDDESEVPRIHPAQTPA